MKHPMFTTFEGDDRYPSVARLSRAGLLSIYDVPAPTVREALLILAERLEALAACARAHAAGGT